MLSIELKGTLIKGIKEKAGSDPEVLRLFETAGECAEIYLIARKRQKGCDGMGELAMVKEEFADSLHELTGYCKGKGYLQRDIRYEIDSVADELAGLAAET